MYLLLLLVMLVLYFKIMFTFFVQWYGIFVRGVSVKQIILIYVIIVNFFLKLLSYMLVRFKFLINFLYQF
jgi:hypothetical protein